MTLENNEINEVVKKVSRSIGDDSETLAAFIYGSMAEGFSNKYSDLDICIITKNRLETKFAKIQGVEVQIESVPFKDMEEKIATAQNRFDFLAALWCHRINTGIPIYDERGIFKQLKERIDLNSIIRNLISFYCGQAVLYVNDSLGGLESGDIETALITARLGVEMAAMAYISSIGILNPKTKWIFRYLLKGKKTDDEMVKQFKKLERIDGSDEEIKKYVEGAMEFINEMTTQAQVPA
jgi:predicted nucleotidyltransferase